MHRLVAAALLVVIVGLPGRAADGSPAAEDERALRAAGVPSDADALLTFFRLRAAGLPPERLAGLVEKLGESDPAGRRRAALELVAVGAPAVPWLRQAVKDPDRPRAAEAARTCLRALENNAAGLSAAAVRALARHRPAGAAEALLAFLPLAEDQGARTEVSVALAALAYTGDTPSPALLTALEDGLAQRRAAAVAALCAGDRSAPVPTLRKLLHDSSPAVRLRAGLALARTWDAPAVSTLVALLADLRGQPAREVLDFLTDLAGDQAPRVPPGTDAASASRCRDAWAAWWRASEAPGLLDEIRKRTVGAGARARAQELIRKLGDDSFDVREQAVAQLKALGATALPYLRQAVKDPDLEVRQRAQACLQAIETGKDVPLSPVTARLLAFRRPPGTAAAVLAFLPAVQDETLAAELQGVLDATAYHDPKARTVLANALTERSAACRAAAGAALARAPGDDHLAALRKLLKDDDLGVRLRVALALAGARRREAVPVLIDLVACLPAGQAEPAEEYLHRLAGNRLPDLPAGDEARAQRRDAWAAWWAAHGDRVALIGRQGIALREPFRGYTLLVQSTSGTVLEVDGAGKVRWQLTGLSNPHDAQVLPGGRVLVTEYSQRRITERNLRGEVLWEKQVPSWPVAAERLPGGTTFIACRDRLLEVDRRGQEVLSIPRPSNDVLTARRLRNGQIVCVSRLRQVVRLDRTGKELKSFPLAQALSSGTEILPDGRVLVPLGFQNKVQEYDTEGKVVWEAAAPHPVAVSRLPNGHTLVAVRMVPARVVELDRAGKEVGQLSATTYVNRVRRR